MTTIVHRTPGLLDVRSFTVMGMSAKPTTGHPIGQFGTGLKYSIAGLLRAGAAVSIWIGREHWQFEVEQEEFRGSSFTRIHAWVRRWGGLRRKRVELPFTTQLGPHWVHWMWLRELHSNTLDEGGYTSRTTDTWTEATTGLPCWEYEHDEIGTCHSTPHDDQTLIVVDLPEYTTAWEARADVFLPGATPLADVGRETLQCLPSASQRLYYRGVRALDLRLPSLYTYNVLEATPLTEDRTMQEWYARHRLGAWLVRECTDQSVIEAILQAEDDQWEHDLELPHHIRPSADFEAAAARCRRLGGRAGAYISGWAPPPPPDTRTFWERRGRRWKLAEEQILDERGRPILTQPEGLSQDDWRDLSEAIVTAVAPVAEGTCPTCHQEIVPSRPPAQPMVVGDLYAGLDHDWQDVFDDEEQSWRRTGLRCALCGVAHTEDNNWDPCTGPAWMQPCGHETTSEATTGDGLCTVTTCLDCGAQTDIVHHRPDEVDDVPFG